MDIQMQIKMALTFTNRSEASLARDFGISPSAFNQRMKAGKFTKAELERIAEILGAKFEAKFVFDDGTEI